MKTIPVELEEAARVDGATTFRVIRKIIAPLMFPGICVVFIFTFSGSWGNFFIPYILLNTLENMPASVKLYQFFGSHGLIMYGIHFLQYYYICYHKNICLKDLICQVLQRGNHKWKWNLLKKELAN